MFLLVAAALFGVFAANVLVGSSGGTAFLSDVGEMLMLLGASSPFVVAVLRSEAARKAKRRKQDTQGRNGNV